MDGIRPQPIRAAQETRDIKKGAKLTLHPLYNDSAHPGSEAEGDLTVVVTTTGFVGAWIGVVVKT